MPTQVIKRKKSIMHLRIYFEERTYRKILEKGSNEDSIKTGKDIALTSYKTHFPPKSIFPDDEFKYIERRQIHLLSSQISEVVIINNMDYSTRFIVDDTSIRLNELGEMQHLHDYKETTRQ